MAIKKTAQVIPPASGWYQGMTEEERLLSMFCRTADEMQQWKYLCSLCNPGVISAACTSYNTMFALLTLRYRHWIRTGGQAYRTGDYFTGTFTGPVTY